jgi:hypothetical protein
MVARCCVREGKLLNPAAVPDSKGIPGPRAPQKGYKQT